MAAAVVLSVVTLVVGFALGHVTASTSSISGERRDFEFQVMGLFTPNQHGQTVNFFAHYRYDAGIQEKALPDYQDLRTMAVQYLTKSDFTHNPYWETLNKGLCEQLKARFLVSAISCELQVPGVENPTPGHEPGYRASIDTIGDIDPLAVPGPVPSS